MTALARLRRRLDAPAWIRRWLLRRAEKRARALFDDAFYRETYADVAAPGFDRFRHFMDHGWREGRNPSPAIDTLFCRDTRPDGAGGNPLLQPAVGQAIGGLRTKPGIEDRGYAQLRRALCAPYFSEPFYRRTSGYDGDDALGHHLAQGWRTAAAPSSVFDPAEHVQQHSFLREQATSPLYHFASQRRWHDEALPLTLDLFADTSSGALLDRTEAPIARMMPPRVVEFEPMPDALRQDLDAIWTRSETGGAPIETRHYQDVYVVGNGLVYTREGAFVGATRHGHTNASVRDGALRLATAVARDRCGFRNNGVLAKTEGAGNYGHFLLEMLPCAWFARRRLGCRYPAIIAGGTSSVERIAREALRTIGFNHEDVVACDDRPVLFRDLIVVGGLAQHPLYISPCVLDCFDDVASGIEAASVDKLYAARGDDATRDFADEEAIARSLAASGFHRVTTGDMSFQAQVAVFKGASHVLGVSGAALTNLLFCPRGTKVTVITPSSASEVLFWMIAELRGLDYVEFRCRESGPQRGSLSWNRNVDLTAAELARVLG